MNHADKINLIKKLGIKDEREIEKFSESFLLEYLKYHHVRRDSDSSIFFLGFMEDELNNLEKIARTFKISIKNRLSENLTFLCVNDGFKNSKRIDKGVELGAILINKNEFLELFNEKLYSIFDNDFIYPNSINQDFRIVTPLSNFNKDIQVESFSHSNEDTIYTVNLYKQTCDCNEFTSNQKIQYDKGDLRRFCKHLVQQYRNSFLPIELEGIKTFLIYNTYSIKNNFKKIVIDNLAEPVYISYNEGNEWCDIFFPFKGQYKRYGYNYIEERFSYNEKPIGFVPILRTELNKVFKKNTILLTKQVIKNNNRVKKIHEKSNTKQINERFFLILFCVTFLVLVIIFLFIIS